MRWNCPHCEELVTAGIDFENTKKAYVRCAKCGGMALVHRSAVLADYVKARRMEDEAQLEAELRMAQVANSNSRIQAMEARIHALNERLSATTAPVSAPTPPIPPPPNAAMRTIATVGGMETESEAIDSPTTPTAVDFESMEEGSVQSPIENDVAAAPPVFTYGKPPAFLLRAPDPTEDRSPRRSKASVRPKAALWIAAAIAIASGAYLYREGKQVFSSSAPTSAAADRSADPGTTN
jgi:hypothetical protein